MFPRALSYQLLQFSLDLYADLVYENKGQNIAFSPFSVGTTLCMLLVGARNETAEQLAEVLHTRVDDKRIHEEFAEVLSKLLIDARDVTFRIANRIYSANSLKVRPDYLSLLESRYLATVKSVDFYQESEAVRLAINDWVYEQTEQKIRDLLPIGSLYPDTVLILINAIYMRASWQFMFDVRETKLQDFHLDNRNREQVYMMYQGSMFRVGHSDRLKCRALEMPYRGGQFSMVILLPDDVEGLSFLEANIRTHTLNSLLRSLEKDSFVMLSVPKFKVEFGLDLEDNLRGMGVENIFEDDLADLTGIFLDKRPKVTNIFHQTVIQVNENGTEAASATVTLGMVVNAVELDRFTVFRVDHPFMFLITTKEMDTILFMGSVRSL